MYLFLCLFSSSLTYVFYLNITRKNLKIIDHIRIFIYSIMVTLFFIHFSIFILCGNVNMSLELNNITTIFMFKYLILSIIVSFFSSLIIVLGFEQPFQIKIEKAIKKRRLKTTIINFVLLSFLILLFFSIKYFLDYYSNVPLEQLSFHLQVPLEGTSDSVINDFLSKAIYPSFIIIISLMFLIIPFTKQQLLLYKNEQRKLILFPIKFDVKKITFAIIATILGLVFYCVYHYDIVDFIKSQFVVSQFVEENYVDPNDVNIEFPSEKKNLIYIYLESMESSYFDTDSGGVLNYNLIPNLYKLGEEEINFSNNDSVGGFNETIGSNWTIAAMVAQTAGLPLKFSTSSSSYNVENNSFLTGVTTLGDILEENGYKNYLYIGSDANFAGRNLYFEQHGSYEIFDYKTAIEEGKIDSDYYVWWGYEDKKLYDFSKEKLLELADNNEPFNFTLLTVDTHPTGGYLDETCEANHEENIENVIECADKMIIDFVNWIKDQDFYENTTIIIVGDHLNMDSSFMDNANERYIYNVILNSSVEPENAKNRKATSFDMFPTTLASIGVEIEDNQLGLGVNLFSNKQTLNEKYGIEKLNNELKKKSTFYQNLSLYEVDN